MSSLGTLTQKSASRWLLLIPQLPASPPYLRVKVWRRLQRLGAISLKNSVYCLPASEQALEDFQWLLREIEQGGGEGAICEANLIDGLDDKEIQQLFGAARDTDYEEIAAQLRPIRASLRRKRKPVAEEDPELKSKIAKLRRRFGEIGAIDFFGAKGRVIVEGLFSEIEKRLAGDDAANSVRVPEPSGGPCRQDMGHAQRRPCRSHRLRMAHSPLHRSAGAVQVRLGQGLRSQDRRASL